MGSGDIAGSTPTLCTTAAEVEAALDALNLAAATDQVHVVSKGNGQFYVFKTERTA